uniref:Uncharacterized protein n=1 Tax=Parascaris equorum TaxID=6256 RepID=A0A914RND9_PAREQ
MFQLMCYWYGSSTSILTIKLSFRSGGEAGVDNWCTNEDAYDYSNDPYLCDYNNQFITGHDSFAGPPSLQSNPNYGVYFDG